MLTVIGTDGGLLDASVQRAISDSMSGGIPFLLTGFVLWDSPSQILCLHTRPTRLGPLENSMGRGSKH
ncbi:MAG: hypothetical protein KC547_07055, partial [Anaerolineae bacterium]|nr:hypothetical protein [Anaerolineae bacterium]